MSNLPVAIESCNECPLGNLNPGCQMHEVVRPPGTLLMEQGVPTQRVWLVKRGTVLLSAVNPSGDEVLCALRGPNSLLGLEALTERPSPMQAWALSEVVLCGMDAAVFRGWVGERRTPLGAVLELALLEANRRGEERMALAGRAVGRLARFLVERRRIEGRDRPLLVQHRVLARMLGMRAETLSRALAKLREEGAIGPGRAVRVADAHKLELLAGDAAEQPQA